MNTVSEATGDNSAGIKNAETRDYKATAEILRQYMQ